MNTRREQWLKWTPRILAIVFILFLALFALDVFGMYNTIWETTVALFMHLIPNFLLLIALIIAWRWPVPGGSLFILLGIASIFAFDTTRMISTLLMITLPPVVIGVLFIVYGLLHEQAQLSGETRSRAAA